jgi:hypothetical protein
MKAQEKQRNSKANAAKTREMPGVTEVTARKPGLAAGLGR